MATALPSPPQRPWSSGRWSWLALLVCLSLCLFPTPCSAQAGLSAGDARALSLAQSLNAAASAVQSLCSLDPRNSHPSLALVLSTAHTQPSSSCGFLFCALALQSYLQLKRTSPAAPACAQLADSSIPLASDTVTLARLLTNHSCVRSVLTFPSLSSVHCSGVGVWSAATSTCLCPFGWLGPQCATVNPALCPRSCSGAGQCVRNAYDGFTSCACAVGALGFDCSLTSATLPALTFSSIIAGAAGVNSGAAAELRPLTGNASDCSLPYLKTLLAAVCPWWSSTAALVQPAASMSPACARVYPLYLACKAQKEGLAQPFVVLQAELQVGAQPQCPTNATLLARPQLAPSSASLLSLSTAWLTLQSLVNSSTLTGLPVTSFSPDSLVQSLPSLLSSASVVFARCSVDPRLPHPSLSQLLGGVRASVASGNSSLACSMAECSQALVSYLQVLSSRQALRGTAGPCLTGAAQSMSLATDTAQLLQLLLANATTGHCSAPLTRLPPSSVALSAAHCAGIGQWNAQASQCSCPYPYQLPSCATVSFSLCANGCSGRGSCLPSAGGVGVFTCACPSGSAGSDCSLTTSAVSFSLQSLAALAVPGWSASSCSSASVSRLLLTSCSLTDGQRSNALQLSAMSPTCARAFIAYQSCKAQRFGLPSPYPVAISALSSSANTSSCPAVAQPPAPAAAFISSSTQRALAAALAALAKATSAAPSSTSDPLVQSLPSLLSSASVVFARCSVDPRLPHPSLSQLLGGVRASVASGNSSLACSMAECSQALVSYLQVLSSRQALRGTAGPCLTGAAQSMSLATDTAQLLQLLLANATTGHCSAPLTRLPPSSVALSAAHCAGIGQWNAQVSQCSCPYPYQLPSCATVSFSLCANGCSGRGSCLPSAGGVGVFTCACPSGSAGSDCSLTTSAVSFSLQSLAALAVPGWSASSCSSASVSRLLLTSCSLTDGQRSNALQLSAMSPTCARAFIAYQSCKAQRFGLPSPYPVAISALSSSANTSSCPAVAQPPAPAAAFISSSTQRALAAALAALAKATSAAPSSTSDPLVQSLPSLLSSASVVFARCSVDPRLPHPSLSQLLGGVRASVASGNSSLACSMAECSQALVSYLQVLSSRQALRGTAGPCLTGAAQSMSLATDTAQLLQLLLANATTGHCSAPLTRLPPSSVALSAAHCAGIGQWNAQASQCSCPYPYQLPSCATVSFSLCANGCSGRGSCLPSAGGVGVFTCACPSGSAGSDCSLTTSAVSFSLQSLAALAVPGWSASSCSSASVSRLLLTSCSLTDGQRSNALQLSAMSPTCARAFIAYQSCKAQRFGLPSPYPVAISALSSSANTSSCPAVAQPPAPAAAFISSSTQRALAAALAALAKATTTVFALNASASADRSGCGPLAISVRVACGVDVTTPFSSSLLARACTLLPDCSSHLLSYSSCYTVRHGSAVEGSVTPLSVSLYSAMLSCNFSAHPPASAYRPGVNASLVQWRSPPSPLNGSQLVAQCGQALPQLLLSSAERSRILTALGTSHPSLQSALSSSVSSYTLANLSVACSWNARVTTTPIPFSSVASACATQALGVNCGLQSAVYLLQLRNSQPLLPGAVARSSPSTQFAASLLPFLQCAATSLASAICPSVVAAVNPPALSYTRACSRCISTWSSALNASCGFSPQVTPANVWASRVAALNYRTFPSVQCAQALYAWLSCSLTNTESGCSPLNPTSPVSLPYVPSALAVASVVRQYLVCLQVRCSPSSSSSSFPFASSSLTSSSLPSSSLPSTHTSSTSTFSSSGASSTSASTSFSSSLSSSAPSSSSVVPTSSAPSSAMVPTSASSSLSSFLSTKSSSSLLASSAFLSSASSTASSSSNVVPNTTTALSSPSSSSPSSSPLLSPSSPGSAATSSSPVPASSTASQPPQPMLSLSAISASSLALGLALPVSLYGQNLQRAAFALLGSANLSAELSGAAIAPDWTALPAVQPLNLSATAQAVQAWAAVNGYLVAYALQNASSDGDLELDLNATQLNFTVPALFQVGYHRLVVLSLGAPPLNLSDWIFVVEGQCTTLLSPDGSCAAACPAGCFCTGDGRCWPQPGWWSPSEHISPTSCVFPMSCPGALEAAPSSDSPAPILLPDGGRNTQRCEQHYQGKVCGDCAANFYHAGAACRFCGSIDAEQRAAFVGLVIGASAIVACIAAIVCLSSPYRLGFRVGYILTLQQVILVGLTSTQLLPTPKYDWLTQVFTDVSIVNLDINMFHPGCAIAALSYVQVFWATLVMVLIALLIFTAAALLRASLVVQHIRGEPHKGYWRWWRRSDEAATIPLPEPTGNYRTDEGSDVQGDERLRQQRMAVMCYIHSFSVHLRPDLAAGFRMGRSSRIHWTPVFRARMLQATLACGVLVYLRLTTVILQMLNCGSVENDAGTGSQLVLLVDRRTLCYEGGHLYAAIVAWALLLGFSLGFPLLLLFLLRRIHSAGYLESKMHDLHVPKALSPSAAGGDGRARSPQQLSAAWELSLEPSLADSTVGESGDEKSIASSHTGLTQLRVNAGDGDGEAANESSVRSTARDDTVSFVASLVQATSPRYVSRVVEREQLTPRDAQLLDARYLQSSVEMVVHVRFSRYGYLLSTLRDERHAFALSELGVNFALACLVVLPGAFHLQVFVSAFAFFVYSVLVSLLWPYTGFTRNVKTIAVNIGLIMQCLIGLSLIQALSTSSLSAAANAAPSVTLQQRLALVTVQFLEGNLAYIVTLVAVVLALVTLSTAGCFVRKVMVSRKKGAAGLYGGVPDALTDDSAVSRPESRASTRSSVEMGDIGGEMAAVEPREPTLPQALRLAAATPSEVPPLPPPRPARAERAQSAGLVVTASPAPSPPPPLSSRSLRVSSTYEEVELQPGDPYADPYAHAAFIARQPTQPRYADPYAEEAAKHAPAYATR